MNFLGTVNQRDNFVVTFGDCPERASVKINCSLYYGVWCCVFGIWNIIYCSSCYPLKNKRQFQIPNTKYSIHLYKLQFNLEIYCIFMYNLIMRKIIVDNKFNNKKLQTFLQFNFKGLSSSMFFKTLRKKDIKVNSKRISNNILIYEHDVIEIYLDDKFLFSNFDLDIKYEDDNILVINKPSGIEVLDNSNHNLTKIIQQNYASNTNFPYPCHRLDRNTTGLLIYAKNEESLNILNKKIEQHEILKFYKCTVVGLLNKKEDTLTDYLFKDSKKSIVYISSIPKQGYKKIITSYKVIEENTKNNLSVLEVQLHTGRTHQIRAHLAHIGHPILR